MSQAAGYNVVGSGRIEPSPNGTVAFEGEPYGSEVSVYLLDYREIGEGPPLHKHPYPETWIVRGGDARFTVGGDVFEAGAGSILVGPAEVPHKFENLGPGNLNVTCIHPSPRFIQTDLEPE